MIKLLDCTLRDGGYYNDWNFPTHIVKKYLSAMDAVGVDIVELGLRSLQNNSFKGANAYTTDQYISSLNVPKSLKVAVMINGAEICGVDSMSKVLEKLFPLNAGESPVDIVRIACHVHEFEEALESVQWFKKNGYTVGFNLMQVADRSLDEISALAAKAAAFSVDALYFADSMGSMDPEQTADIIKALKVSWKGELGIHTHDNMGLALSNTMKAVSEGVTWLDSTVTGMGRGPGNARTEELAIELAQLGNRDVNLVPLMGVINEYFQPLKNECGWGSNPYYFLSGKYGIHPSYVQIMAGDKRYTEEDILTAIEQLKVQGGKKFSIETLESTRDFYKEDTTGQWSPVSALAEREVLLLGTGPGVGEHKEVISQFIKKKSPIVIALNTESSIPQNLVDFRVACHPLRLLADCDTHRQLPQPLITPASMLTSGTLEKLKDKKLLDYGLKVSSCFEFDETSCKTPSSLVICYALALISSGKAQKVYMAGFDGYEQGDVRNTEMNNLLNLYQKMEGAIELISITPSCYEIKNKSVYGLIG